MKLNKLIAPICRNRHFTLIPYARMKLLFANSARLRLICKRDDDCPVCRHILIPLCFLPFKSIIESEFPFSIQIDPWLTIKLRSWVFLIYFELQHTHIPSRK